MDAEERKRMKREKKAKSMLMTYEKICSQMTTVSAHLQNNAGEEGESEIVLRQRLVRKKQFLENKAKALKLSLSVLAVDGIDQLEEEGKVFAVQSDDEEGCGRLVRRRGRGRGGRGGKGGRGGDRGRTTRLWLLTSDKYEEEEDEVVTRVRTGRGGVEGVSEKYEKLLRILFRMERKMKNNNSLLSDAKFQKRRKRLQEMQEKMRDGEEKRFEWARRGRGVRKEKRKEERMGRTASDERKAEEKGKEKEEGEETEDMILQVVGLKLNDD